MGNEISTVGGALATAGTSIAAGITFGQVDELNDAVVSCAKFTASKAEKTVVKSIAETAVFLVLRLLLRHLQLMPLSDK